MPGPSSDHQVPNPYVGPRAFRRSEAALFQGRGEEARDLRALWRTERVTVLHGPAGVGKTSLLHAGALPLLADDHDVEVLPVGRLVQPSRPVAVPAQGRGNPYVATLLDSWDAPDAAQSVAEFIRSRLTSRVGPDDAPYRLLGAVDHVEGLFTSYPPLTSAWTELLDELAAALSAVPEFNLLLVVRDDHLPLLEAQSNALGDRFKRLRLTQLSVEAAIEAIERPLDHTARHYAEGVAAEMVDELRTVPFKDMLGNDLTVVRDCTEPLLLQIASSGLWAALPSETVEITADQFRRLGGRRALRSYVDSAVAAVARDHGYPEQTIRDWLAQSFVTEMQTRGSAHRGPSVTAGMANAVVDALVDWQILTTELRFDLLWYQLGQDQLVKAVLEAAQSSRPAMPSHKITPTDPNARYRNAAEAALGLGELADARRYASVAVEGYERTQDRRGQALALELLGDCARADLDLRGADAAYREARSIFAELQDNAAIARVHTVVAGLRRSEGRYAEAVDLLHEAVTTLPNDKDVLVGLGYAQWYEGALADAVATFSRALRYNIRVAAAFAGRGQIRVELREFDAALEDLRRALDLGYPDPDASDLHSALAFGLASLGRLPDADRELNLARQTAPNRAWTRLWSGRIAELRGDPDLARTELEAALTARPTLPSSLRRTIQASLARLRASPAAG